MKRKGDHIELTTEEARGGSTPHIVRYILAISLGLVVLAMAVIWLTGTASVAG